MSAKAHLYTLASGYSIMADLIGYAPIPGQAFCSPLRVDRHPSFVIYQNVHGEWRYKDFSRPDVGGSCVDLYMALHNVSSFSVAVGALIRYYMQRRPSFLAPSSCEYREPVPHNIALRPFADEDYAYWGVYHVLPKTLQRYGVGAVQRWSIGRQMLYDYEGDAHDLCYVIYHPSGRFKLYWPLRGKQDLRFLATIKSGDLWGYHRLFRHPYVVITKSFKDVLVLAQAGIPAVSASSESIRRLPAGAVAALHKAYQQVFILFDNDEAGIAGAQRLAVKHRLSVRVIPPTFGKDAADLAACVGPQAACALLRRIFEHVPALSDSDQ